MTIEKAWAIVGNQPKWAIRNMVKALSIHTRANTREHLKMLEAGKICLKSNNPRYTVSPI